MNTFRTFFAYDPGDKDEVRLEKFAALLISGSCTLAGLIWTAMYYYVFGWSLTALLPAIFVLIVGSAILVSHFSKNHFYAIYTQIICIIYITFFIQWSIGGVYESGFVMVWAFIGPICALMFFSVRQSLIWLSLYLLNLGISTFFNDYFAMNGQVVSETARLFFFVMNLGIASVVVFIFASYYVNAAVQEQRKARQLLETNLQQEMVLRQSEKLATLGRLSAGVAHELNNPAAASQRGAEQLRASLEKLEVAEFSLGQAGLSKDQIIAVDSQIQQIEMLARKPNIMDSLLRSNNEAEIETWLEDREFESAWDLAPLLVNIGFGCDDLSKLSEQFTLGEFQVVVELLCRSSETRTLLEEIGQGIQRITEIVKALKSYSYLDQAPMQSIDIHEGLNDTLVMLSNKLKSGVLVKREYDQSLPKIDAYGSELNQVWTNIIDNAVSAMDGQGELILKTYLQDSCVVVEFRDSGPGIPPENQAKIFDPFFTTKAPGEGTGLGLNISYNIVVQKHSGTMDVNSRPGQTIFLIKLPISPANT